MELINLTVRDVLLDPNWNSRLPGELTEERLRRPPDDGSDEGSLYESIAEGGVRTPVEVAPAIVDGECAGRYPLVAGFRRVACVILLDAAGVPSPSGDNWTIPALVRADYAADEQRRRGNLLENIARKDLLPVELSRGLYEYERAAKKAGTWRGYVAEAADIGVNRTTFQSYSLIRRTGSRELLEHWELYPGIPQALVLEAVKLPRPDQLNWLVAAHSRKQRGASNAVVVRARMDEVRAIAADWKGVKDGPCKAGREKERDGWVSGVQWLAARLGVSEMFGAEKRRRSPKDLTGESDK